MKRELAHVGAGLSEGERERFVTTLRKLGARAARDAEENGNESYRAKLRSLATTLYNMANAMNREES